MPRRPSLRRPARSLRDVVHCDNRLYLVFEYLDLDMKKHFDSNPQLANDRRVIKARAQHTQRWRSRPPRLARRRLVGVCPLPSLRLSVRPPLTASRPPPQQYLQQILLGVAFCHSHRCAGWP